MSKRTTPFTIGAEEFRRLGHDLVDDIARFYASLPDRPVTRATSRDAIRALLADPALPVAGTPAAPLFRATAASLFEHSLHNGHPRFMGYITSSAAPLGALGDLLAASINANVGLWDLAPIASEIEAQTVGWLAELIGFPTSCGGLMVSGGNMANLIAFFAARRAKTPWNVREQGLYGDPRRLLVYASRETHTWIQKAADLSGIGTDAVRFIETDAAQRIRVDKLESAIERDRAAGHLPFLVVGAAGTVGTGAVDPLPELAALCVERGLWFHVDGAYGAPAASLPEAPADLRGLAQADSVALDPHKWLYCPIEAGCTLVRDPQHLIDAYSFHPEYYRLETAEHDPKVNYYEHGIQNTRGFRALKVWLMLKHVGRAGYVEMFREDIALAQRLFAAAEAAPELEARTQNLSLTTLRYVPPDLSGGGADVELYLNALNEALVARLQKSGEAFLSNAVVDGAYLLRACIVNFRTTADDIDAIVASIVRMGRELDRELRPSRFAPL